MQDLGHQWYYIESYRCHMLQMLDLQEWNSASYLVPQVLSKFLCGLFVRKKGSNLEGSQLG